MSKEESSVYQMTETQKEYRVVVFHIAKHKSYRVYCRKYGNTKGDEVLCLMQDTVRSKLQGRESLFVLDTENVLAILEKGRYQSVCAEIENTFEEKVQSFYLPEDIQKGYIKAENKHGEMKK